MTTTPAETITEQTVVAIAQLIWSVVDDDETRAMNATSLAGTLIRDMAGKLQALPKALQEEPSTFSVRWPTPEDLKRERDLASLRNTLVAAQRLLDKVTAQP